MDELLYEFLTETNESLVVLDVELVKLERNPNDPELLGNIFRLMHTIKGTCGFLDLPRLEAVAHAGENVLGKLRDGELEIGAEAISLVLECLDRIRALVAALEETEAEPDGDDGRLIARLNALAEGGAAVAATEAAAASCETRQPKESTVAGQTVRVSVELLENLMTTVSELVLTRNQCLQILRGQEDSAFQAPLQRLDQIVSELQEGVMKTRMQPIGNAWAKLPRIVRDLSHELDKKIDLVMKGADTELDRQVLELIKDPLTHMVRNAADHGLETTAERVAAGKPETGSVELNAYHEGGHIVIQIADDGCGLAVDKIKRKAIKNGLATEAELNALSDNQVVQYIFKPGFSTAEVVTAISGRGVGMDVVRNNIEKIGGTVELSSAEGRGTTFLIKIPLTLAIVSVLVVACGGERFAIPQISVVELVRACADSEHKIERINNTPVLRLRDRLLPLVALRDLLQLGGRGRDERQTADEGAVDGFIVVIQVGAYSFGLIVDRVFDTEEIVVKPLAPILRDITLFSGNTILGDGSVVMILDPNGIAAATGGINMSDDVRGREPERKTEKAGVKMAMLVFRAAGEGLKAVPLSLVARLEEIDLANVERSNSQHGVRYRGKLMPLVPAEGAAALGQEGRQAVIVFTDAGRSMGLAVDEIVDIVEEHIDMELSSGRSGYLGSAIIAGQAIDIIDPSHYLTIAFQDWSAGECRMTAERATGRRVLLVDDSPFVRNLLVPLLAVAGYDVTAVETGSQALELCQQGEAYDVILSDIEMPNMNGFEFAQEVRANARWAGTPLVALSSSASPEDLARGRSVGFDDYVAKSDREALLQSLRETLAYATGAA